MRHLALFAALVALLLPPGALAQDGVTTDDVVELDTTLVEVPVVVSEAGGRYVTDLGPSDFTIYENGVRQQVDFFAAVDEPISVALVLDTSGSTRDKLERIKEAASVFLDQLRAHDRVSLVCFEDEVRILTPLTPDRARLRAALAGLQPGQYTQVYEAVHAVAEDVFEDVGGRKAAIIFTDGVDTASPISTFEDSLADIAGRQVIVYPIRYNTRPDVEARLGLPPPGEESRVRRVSEPGKDADPAETRRALDQVYHVGDAYLWEIASRTGGVLHRADRLDDLPAAFGRIADELRHQYLLGYYPARKDLDDAERHITVTVSRPSLTVRSREAYRPAKRN
jgi:VWFA-related protein